MVWLLVPGGQSVKLLGLTDDCKKNIYIKLAWITRQRQKAFKNTNWQKNVSGL